MPSIVSGLPARPTATMRPSAIPRLVAAHAKDRVGDEPADDRELHAAAPGPHAEPVAQRAAEARQDLVGPATPSSSGTSCRAVSPRRTASGTAVAPLARQPSAVSRAPGASSGPSTSPPCPRITRAPPNGRRRTVTGWPGSKKTFTPAGTSSRMPHAAARSKRSARLTSKTWKCEVSPFPSAPAAAFTSPVAMAAENMISEGAPPPPAAGIRREFRTATRAPGASDLSLYPRASFLDRLAAFALDVVFIAIANAFLRIPGQRDEGWFMFLVLVYTLDLRRGRAPRWAASSAICAWCGSTAATCASSMRWFAACRAFFRLPRSASAVCGC